MLGSIWLVIALLGLAGICAYVRFYLGPEWHGHRPLEFSALALLILAAAFSYLIFRNVNASHELAQYVIPYPNLTMKSFQHFPVDSTMRSWIYESDDALHDVMAFYEDEAHTTGWHVQRRLLNGGVRFELRRDDRQMRITVENFIGKTIVVYRLDREIP